MHFYQRLKNVIDYSPFFDNGQDPLDRSPLGLR